jgi:glycosyltransferase involved in cell wall biosynthesis
VAGTVLTDRLKNNTFQGVNLLGHVPNLNALYETKKAFVAATRFATGIPWKVHEAMANGIPCLISTLLAQQLAVTDGKEVLVASNPQEFIEKSKRLHDDKELWIKLKMNGFDLIRRDCNPDDFRDILQANLFW